MRFQGSILIVCAGVASLVAPSAHADTLSATVVAGDNQSVVRTGGDPPGGRAVFAPLKVKVTHADGSPASGVQVGFRSSGPNAMALQLEPAGAESTSILTDGSGVATLNHMIGSSIYAYYAQGPFSIVASVAGGPQLTFHLAVAPTPPPPPPAPNPKMAIVSGDHQTHARLMSSNAIAMANFDALAVKVTGADGSPLANVPVTWAAKGPGAMAVQTEPSGAAPCIVHTDGQGIARLAKMGGHGVTAYYADGAFTVTASYGTASATFSETVGGAANPSHKAAIVSGDNQSSQRTGGDPPGGRATFAPLKVKVTNNDGSPAAGVAVGFHSNGPNAMAVQMEPAGGSGDRLTTDGNGVATLDHMLGSSIHAYYADGPFTVTASVDDGPQLTFHLRVTPPPPPPPPLAGAKLELVSGDHQAHARAMTAAGIPMADFDPLVVKLTKSDGTPLAGVHVEWTSSHPGPMAVQTEPSGASPCLVTTDAQGVARLAKMGGHGVTAYYADGAFTVTAKYGSAHADFALSVGAPLAAPPAPPAPPKAVAPPAGSYAQSCRNTAVQGTTLVGECRRANGTYDATKLAAYAQCTGDIANLNGALACVAGGAPAHPALPRGSYIRTCQHVAVRGPVLEAICQKRNGAWVAAKMADFVSCQRDVANIDGVLKCQ